MVEALAGLVAVGLFVALLRDLLELASDGGFGHQKNMSLSFGCFCYCFLYILGIIVALALGIVVVFGHASVHFFMVRLL